MTACHVCEKCGGTGLIRVRGKNGSVRVPCPACGGTGGRGGPYR